ncbi:MAG: hypothetical protein CMJ36_04555 [Phycisphaerae bacterium]|nr:hypothetical protein [Phycisphaerae bacterium]
MDELLVNREDALATISLNDPGRRNALTVSMLDGLESALKALANDPGVQAVLLRGEGSFFCAGFDLGAIVDEPMTLQDLVARLGRVTMRMRSLPAPVILAAKGAAIAGGCALLTGADIVVLGDETKVGYPVHALGISPAVTIPTLSQAAGDGPARAMLMDGRLRTGREVLETGLGADLVSEKSVDEEAGALARHVASLPPVAVKATKRWLNELDGSNDPSRWTQPVEGSAPLAGSGEAVDLLGRFWKRKSSS